MDLLTDAAMLFTIAVVILLGVVRRRRRSRRQMPSVSDQWLVHYRETEHP